MGEGPAQPVRRTLQIYLPGNHMAKREKSGAVLAKTWNPRVVLEKTLESPLDCKETKPVSSKGNQP